MKKLFNSFNSWFRRSNRFKEKNIYSKEGGEKFRSVMLPDDTYLTREGQMILPPVERIQTIRIK